MKFWAVSFFVLSLLTAVSVHAEECVSHAFQMILNAKAARLHYADPDRPGITRTLRGKKFIYRDANGRIIRDPKILERINHLAIPPAYTDVWISPDPKDHIQSKGYDEAGRPQYRYHPKWEAYQARMKFNRMQDFGKALPEVRAKIDQDLSEDGLGKPKVLATLVRLLETTYIRVGNEDYAKDNKTYGLTTMRKSFVDVEASKIHFDFDGKEHKPTELDTYNLKVARTVAELKKLPGWNLFKYLDEKGKSHELDSNDVNDYIREKSGGNFTAKDFRTWGGTTSAAKSLTEAGPPLPGSDVEAQIDQAVVFTSNRLKNTPAVARENYIDPRILDAYRKNEGREFFMAVAAARKSISQGKSSLNLEEQTVLNILKSESKH